MGSAAHGVLLLAAMCRRVSLYGFAKHSLTAIVQPERMPLWQWHDHVGEQLTWRLLHAAGVVDLCSAGAA